MKWLSVSMGIVFVGFAVVQYNDPDALRWIVIYTLAAVVSFAAAYGKCPIWLPGVIGAAFLLWSMSLWPALPHIRPESFTKMYLRDPTDEEVRESLGLLLGAVWCAWVSFWLWRRSPART